MSAAGGTTLYDASRGGGVLAQNGNLAGVPDLEALLSCSESCFKVLDLDGRILYVSPSASRVLRVDPARLLGCVNAA
jgi:PAS domain-containing protein